MKIPNNFNGTVFNLGPNFTHLGEKKRLILPAVGPATPQEKIAHCVRFLDFRRRLAASRRSRFAGYASDLFLHRRCVERREFEDQIGLPSDAGLCEHAFQMGTDRLGAHPLLGGDGLHRQA